MRAKWNARRSAAAKRVAARSTRSVDPDGGSSSGRTADSDSANLGSNPSPPAKFEKTPHTGAGFFFRRSDELHAAGTTDDQQVGRARREQPDGHHAGDLIEARLQRHPIAD